MDYESIAKNRPKRIPYVVSYSHHLPHRFPISSASCQAGAGGLYALHGPSEEKWTEEYQSAVARGGSFLVAVASGKMNEI
jgi:seryl-tRNA(Sec) selenium transferase